MLLVSPGLRHFIAVLVGGCAVDHPWQPGRGGLADACADALSLLSADADWGEFRSTAYEPDEHASFLSRRTFDAKPAANAVERMEEAPAHFRYWPFSECGN